MNPAKKLVIITHFSSVGEICIEIMRVCAKGPAFGPLNVAKLPFLGPKLFKSLKKHPEAIFQHLLSTSSTCADTA